MTDGNLCDIKMLETGNDDPDKNTQQSRERYAIKWGVLQRDSMLWAVELQMGRAVTRALGA